MHPYHVEASVLDIAHPASQGLFAMPDYYFELRHQQLAAMHAALDVFETIADEFEGISGRGYRSLESYRIDDAEHVIVCLGSTGGTVKDVVDELRLEGARVGVVEVRSFRPFPRERVRALLDVVPTVSVLDRADSPGGAPPLFADVAAAGAGAACELRSFVYGLGGRDLHPDEIRSVFEGESAPGYLSLRGAPCPV
jgi:pyruvate ferredoxin oxidoreductase alpha subunit